MSRWIPLFLLISCHCVTCFKAESPCNGFRGTTSDVRGVIGENISLTCKVPTNCTRGYWKYDDTTNAKWLLPEVYSGDTYVCNFNFSQGLNTLHIYNISSSVAGFYTCLCDDRYRHRTAHACFNLSVHDGHCPIRVPMINKKRVFNRCIVKTKVETIDVKLNENITIKCDDEVKRKTNCSQLEKLDTFKVAPSHHLCGFRCPPKRGSKSTKCEIKWMILNVTDDVISSTTETSTIQTSNIASTNYKYSSSSLLTTLSSPPSFSDPSEPKQSTTTPLSLRSVSYSSFRSTTMTTSAVKINGSTTSVQEFSNRTLFIIVVSCIILVGLLTIIILILCVRITFYKIGIRSCNYKEEWVNPLYESVDNGTQLQIEKPDGGNPYGTVSSPRLMTDFSSPISTTNNVHQINADLRSTNEIPMTQVGTSQNVAVKLLDYTVTSSNVGYMELNKPGCKKIKSSAAATETLSLPKVDEISPPASPHLYEMLDDEVRP